MVSSTSTPLPFDFEPGVYRDLTAKQASNKIVEGDHIRFLEGRVGVIGGWAAQLLQGTILSQGVARSLLFYRNLAGEKWGIYGTNKRLVVIQGGDTRYDVTPLESSATIANPFTTVNTSPTVTFTNTLHSRSIGDTILFSTPVVYNGITFSGPYDVTAVIDANNFQFVAGQNATASGTGGGASVAFSYYIKSGAADDGSTEGGFGVGTYGTGTWGTPRASGAPVSARVWCLKSWGEDVLCVPTRGGAVYYWDTSVGVATRAQKVATAPDQNDFMIVASALRQVFLFGTKDISGVYDPLLLRWSDSEDYTNFDPTTPSTSQAGEYRLTKGNKIVGAYETTSGEIIVWTDLAVYRLRPTGGDDIYSLELLTEGSGLVGPNAIGEAEGILYWVAPEGFRMYDGTVRILRSTMDRTYFDNGSDQVINFNQSSKIFIGRNSQYSELWIFVCSGSATEINRYMIYDFKESLFADGTMTRTCWVDKGVDNVPYAMDTAATLFAHESGTSANGSPLNPYFRIGYTALNDSKDVMFIDRVIPDGAFVSNHDFTLYGVDQPVDGATTVTKTKPFTGSTPAIDIRFRSRYNSLKISTSVLDGKFLVGKFTIYAKVDGQR